MGRISVREGLQNMIAMLQERLENTPKDCYDWSQTHSDILDRFVWSLPAHLISDC